MDNSIELPELVRENSPATLVVHGDGQLHAIHATIRSLQPFQLTIGGNPNLVAKQRFLLLIQNDGKVARAEAEAVKCGKVGAIWVLEAENLGWQESDRRRHPRIPVDLPADLRTVNEDFGATVIRTISGKFLDLSLSGGWFEAEHPAPVGVLVHFTARLSETLCARGLALVARASDQDSGMGLEFVEYIGASRADLTCFLERIAA